MSRNLPRGRPGGEESDRPRHEKPKKTQSPSRQGSAPGNRHRLEILFEDRGLIVVIKPVGLPVIGMGREKTALDLLNTMLRNRGIKEPAAVVHRLDRDTSGVMVFARSGKMKKAMMENWNELVTKRVYIALVAGIPPEKEGTIRSNLKENRGHAMYSVGTDEGGFEAVTHYRLIRSSRGFSLLALELETGRKNQIRVHLADIGCPIVGDEKYGSVRAGRPAGTDEGRGIGRLGLHALGIAFRHPETREELKFLAPLPGEFLKAVGLSALPEGIF
jgi:23S rRNA pseudouridine1911/1915/1917 synthase